MNNIFFPSLFYYKYIYVDTHDYLADGIFYKNKIPVRVQSEFVRDGDNYRLVVIKVRKKFKDKIERSFVELRNKMLIYGYNDYDDYCEEVFKHLTR